MITTNVIITVTIRTLVTQCDLPTGNQRPVSLR